MNRSIAENKVFSKYEVFVIVLLAFLQFTIILDFMILAPLGAFLMPSLKITTSQFGAVVSAYAISSAISALFSAGFADRFDRKKMLLFFYAGFIVGTLMCGMAGSYSSLLFARIVTGIFGGVIGSICLAIMADIFEFNVRGRVMGYLQTAFSASQILGLPLGLYLTNRWNWHLPFLAIVGVSCFAFVAIILWLKPLTSHLALQGSASPLSHVVETFKNKWYLISFCATGLLSMGGFMIMPFASAFTINNLEISAESLPMIYFVTGVASFFIGPVIGRLADKFGKMKVFYFGSMMMVLMVLIYTHLGPTPLVGVITINILMFVGIFSRMIPSQALMSAIPVPANRGSYMAVSSSLQSLAGGIGTMVAGWIVVQESSGKIQHFNQIGYVMVGIAVVCMGLMFHINKYIDSREGHKI